MGCPQQREEGEGEKTTGAGGGWDTAVGATVGAETGAVVAKHLSQVVWQYPSGASAVGAVILANWQLPAILCSNTRIKSISMPKFALMQFPRQ